jgi:hypothetical protein
MREGPVKTDLKLFAVGPESVDFGLELVFRPIMYIGTHDIAVMFLLFG